MKVIRVAIAVVATLALAGWGSHGTDAEPEWPHSGPMPDNPVKIKPLRYDPIGRGNQSYRPIAPMPWGDVNRRVAPPGALPPPSPPPPAKGGAVPRPIVPPLAAVPSPPRAPAAATSPAVVPVPVQIVPVLPSPLPSPSSATVPLVPSDPDHSKHGVPPPKQ